MNGVLRRHSNDVVCSFPRLNKDDVTTATDTLTMLSKDSRSCRRSCGYTVKPVRVTKTIKVPVLVV